LAQPAANRRLDHPWGKPRAERYEVARAHNQRKRSAALRAAPRRDFNRAQFIMRLGKGTGGGPATFTGFLI